MTGADVDALKAAIVAGVIRTLRRGRPGERTDLAGNIPPARGESARKALQPRPKVASSERAGLFLPRSPSGGPKAPGATAAPSPARWRFAGLYR